MITYGRGAASVGEQIGKTKEEAQEIIDKFFKAFPAVKKWVDSSIDFVHQNGYVTDVAGRRRRLPDAQLPKYQIIDHNEGSGTFNPFIGCSNRIEASSLTQKYQQKLDKIKYAKEYEKIQADALKENVEIHSNTGFIAQAERQAVNAQIQGSAATLTKCALIRINSDPRLKELGAYLINTVHDEILIEAPAVNAEKAAEYLIDDMLTSAKMWVDVPMAADDYQLTHWYEDEFAAALKKIYDKKVESGKSESEAEAEIAQETSELTIEQVHNALHKDYIF